MTIPPTIIQPHPAASAGSGSSIFPGGNAGRAIGAVAIGRNEGLRLEECLKSLTGKVRLVVYVDSGSTDGSVALAESLGVHVVGLDLSVPFTAARARNAGFERLLELWPNVEFVQFIDGDCEINPSWPPFAAGELAAHPAWAAVCGRRRERFPERSVYNRICDVEWNTPPGETAEFGGDVLIRVAAFQQVHGYNPKIIAAEDSELSVRLRLAGWKLFRLDAEMTLHDVAITCLGQWWKRSRRAGHGYADNFAMHGGPPMRHRLREVRSVCVWGFLFPVTMLAIAWPTRGASLVMFLLYILPVYRIWRYGRRRGFTEAESRAYAFFCVFGRFPEFLGMVTYWKNRFFGRPARIIEYKSASAAAVPLAAGAISTTLNGSTHE